MKYEVYAVDKNGDGYGQFIGSYDDPTDIKIRVGMFADDVVIKIIEVCEDET